MKGYTVANGYRGWVPSIGMYILFATEDEYKEYYRESE